MSKNKFSSIVFAVLLMGCKWESGDDDMCFTKRVTNSYAPEKVNAGFCFVVVLPGKFYCSYYPEYDETFCEGSKNDVVIQFRGQSFGEVYNYDTNAYLGRVQLHANTYELAYQLGNQSAECNVTGNELNYCSWH